MICCGTSAAAGSDNTVTQRVASGSSFEAREPVAVSRSSERRPRMDLTTISGRGAVYYLEAPAPPNDCGAHSFEILNPDPGEPRCVGVDLN